MKRYPDVRMVSPSVSPFILASCLYPPYWITQNRREKSPGMMAWLGPFGPFLFRVTVAFVFIAIRWIMIGIDTRRTNIENSAPDILKKDTPQMVVFQQSLNILRI